MRFRSNAYPPNAPGPERVPGRAGRRARALRFARGLTVAGLMVAGLTVAGLAGVWVGGAGAAPREYTVDSEATSLRVIVFRRGVFSALAHDHVLVVKGVTGRIVFNPDAPAGSRAELHVPVTSIEVDDPKERAKENFTSDLNESNRASVRENMLAANQLAATAFPRIEIFLEGVEGTGQNLRAKVRVRIRHQEQTLTVPVVLKEGAEGLTVRGQVDMLQSAFGIEPYTALFGAIAVQDSVQVRFEIVGRPSR